MVPMYIETAVQLLQKALYHTAIQLVWFILPLSMFGVLLHVLTRIMNNSFYGSRTLQRVLLITTGWIGVPVHELGHVVFCLLFRHRVTRVVLFQPNSSDGCLGYVNHQYNRQSVYASVGNLFIGVGPLLFGSVVILVIFRTIVPGASALFATLANVSASNLDAAIDSGATIVRVSGSFLSDALRSGDIYTLRFLVFLYVSLCIATHMNLSSPDIRSAISGLKTLLTAVTMANTVLVLAEYFALAERYMPGFTIDTVAYTNRMVQYLTVFSATLFVVSIIVVLCFIAGILLLSIYSLVRYQRLTNPFCAH